ncbi:MAG TPA: right-handed parallel beta-helix repeat-containing protein [Waterburya sp.]|jgi:parallel beta-helix repeat protein
MSSYYVATNGSDDNPGTIDLPLATLSQAATKAASGDTVNVRGGTYTFSKTQYIGSAGIANAPITYQAYPGEKVILDGSQMAADSSLVNIAGQYNTFQNFELTKAKGVGIISLGTQHIQIRNNIVHDSYRDAILVGSMSDMTSTTDIVIDGNTAYNNALVTLDKPNDFPAIINSYGASNVTITNNQVYQNYGIGIDFILTKGGVASGNVLHDNYSVNLYLDNASDMAVERNLIYTTNDPKFYWMNGALVGHPASGIQVANEPYKISNPANNLKIRNNLAIGGSSGFFYGNYGNGGGLKNSEITHNTFYKSTNALFHIDDDAGHANNAIADNIFYQTDGKPIVKLTTNLGMSFQHNTWFGGSAGAAVGSGDTNADPLFVNPGGTTFNDYKLQVGSPATGTGIVDIANVPATPSIGSSGNALLLSQAGNDSLLGTTGNDHLVGGTGNNSLTGVNAATNAGKGEIDLLNGGAGADQFMLGDANKVFYDDGLISSPGQTDYATLADFNTLEDKIVLHGSASSYQLGELPTGTGIYYATGQTSNELIGVVTGVSPTQLNLTDSSFTYV